MPRDWIDKGDQLEEAQVAGGEPSLIYISSSRKSGADDGMHGDRIGIWKYKSNLLGYISITIHYTPFSHVIENATKCIISY